MFRFVHHVHYLVSDLDAMVAFMERTFGIKPEEDVDPHTSAHAEREAIREVVYRVAETRIEMTQPLDPDSKYGRRLAEHGPHVMHVAWGVDDLEQVAAQLTAHGVRHEKKIGPRGYRTVNIDLEAAMGTHFQLAQD